MADYFLEENRLTQQLFNLDELLEFQLRHDIQIVRGADYNYMCQIDGVAYATGLTPLFALVYGVQCYTQRVNNS